MSGTVTFMEAVRSRYGAPDDTAAYSKDAFLVGDPSKRRNKTWELVGMDDMRAKQSRLDRIFVVSVKDSGLTCAEVSENEITAAKLVNVTELDLSGNAALSMSDIDTIVHQMPRLQLLQLSGIPLARSLSIPSSWTVSKLVLNFVGLESIDLLANVQLPRLEELHLDGNKLTNLHSSLGPNSALQFGGVRRLSLAQNQLASWDDGVQWCFTHVFPAVEHVSFSGNPLPDIACSDASDRFTFMEKLTSLWISECPHICARATLEQIRVRAPRLEGFHISYQFMFPKLAESQARALVVASLPALTLLNNASVRKKERTDAELFYLQRGLAEDAATRERDYPLVEALKTKYAGVVLAPGTAGNASATAHVMLKLRFRVDGRLEEVKTVPSSLHVEKLKTLVKSMFSIDPARQELSFSAADIRGFAPPIPLDNDLQTLAYFGVGSDAVIRVVDMDAAKS